MEFQEEIKQGNKTGGTAEEAYGNVDLGSALKRNKLICLNMNLVHFLPDLCKPDAL